MSEYLVLIEKGENDRNPIEGHLRCMRDAGEPIPEAGRTLVARVRVA
jgi:hypothetical protein